MELAPLSLADATTLRAALDPVTPILILVDPMLGEPLPFGAPEGADIQAARAAMWERPVMPIALSPRIKLPPHQHPYLVALEGLSDPLLETALEIAQDERMQAQSDGLDGEGAAAHRIGGWLQSSLHFSELAEHLSAMLQVNTEARTNATYLRLVDRRVLALLCYVLGDTLVAQSLGRLQNWVYLDAQGQISTLNTMGEACSPLRLDHEQWARMQAGEMVNRTLALWLGEAHRRGLDDVRNTPSQALYAPLFNAVARAMQAAQIRPHRFQQPLDQSVWAALLLLDPEMEHSDTVIQLLNSTSALDDPSEPAEPLRYLHHAINALVRDKAPQHTPAR